MKYSDKSLKRARRKHLLVALLAGLLSLYVVYWMWMSYEQDQQNARKSELELTGNFTFQEITKTVEHNIHALENLKSRIEVTNGAYFDFWTHDAQRIIKQNPSFRFIEWIDSNMVIRSIEPLKGNEAVMNLDINTVEYRKQAWLDHVKDTATNITPWAEMRQGGEAFLVDAPMYYKGRFQGTITAGMDFTRVFNQLMLDHNNYAVLFKDEKGNIFYQHNNPSLADVGEELTFSSKLKVDQGPGDYWYFYMVPNNFNPDWPYKGEGLFSLGLGIFMSILVGLLTFSFQRVSLESRRIKEVNTQLMNSNDQLEQQRQKAERASRSKTDFISTMSHEIRTPLNAILGFIEILKSNNLAEEEKGYLQMMDLSSKNLLSLVDDILEVDKIESGKVVFHRKAFNPAAELEKLIQIYRPGFEEKGLYLNIQCNIENAAEVMGDVGKFNQIFTNLLRNAYKFTETGGVTVYYDEWLKDDSVEVRVEVEDSGIGIPSSKLKEIFKRFTQVDTGLSRRHEGSGLGLAITQQLLGLMGGDIKVISTEGEGSTFKVQIPYPLTEKPSEKSNLQVSDQEEFAGKKVLIVEDNAMNVMVLKKSLMNMKLSTVVAENGVIALDKLEEQSFDMVFMDIHMPEMDGLTATRELRKRNIDVPVVALSANVTREALEDAERAGMQEYITKPFTRSRLLEVLNKYLSVKTA